MEEKTFEIISNLAFMIITALLAITAIIAVIFYGAYWHLWSALVCSGLSVLFFYEKIDGKNSVKTWLSQKFSKR